MMTCCALCGVVKLGGDGSSGVVMNRMVQPPGVEAPPYGVANTFMLPYCAVTVPEHVTAHGTVAEAVFWNVCSLCKESPRTAFVAYHTVHSLRAVLNTDPLHVQTLALVDLALGFQKKVESFTHCEVSKTTLLDGALVQMNPWTTTATATQRHYRYAPYNCAQLRCTPDPS